MAGAMITETKMVVELDKRRREVAESMLAIRVARRGKISEQFLKVPHKGKKNPVVRGPYYVLSWWENGRCRSRRIKKDALERTREELANYERLEALFEEFEHLTQALGDAEHIEAATNEAVKKRRKSPSSKAKKSRA